jgi:hypothetical protein
MFFMVTETWPSTSSVELGKASIESISRPLPEFMKRLGNYVVFGGDGVKAYALYEAEDGKEREGYKEVVGRFAQFMSVEGFKCNVEIVLPIDEALPLIGL